MAALLSCMTRCRCPALVNWGQQWFSFLGRHSGSWSCEEKREFDARGGKERNTVTFICVRRELHPHLLALFEKKNVYFCMYLYLYSRLLFSRFCKKYLRDIPLHKTQMYLSIRIFALEYMYLCIYIPEYVLKDVCPALSG